MRRVRNTCAALLSLVFAASLPGCLSAQHVVWVDFSTRSFNPYEFDNLDLRNSRSWNRVKAQILHELADNYANYEIQFVPFEPPAGRYTRLVIGGKVLAGGSSNALGTSLPWATCPSSECGKTLQATDHGSWKTDRESVAFVFSDEFAGGYLTGADATEERVASAIAKVASHELGHILGLEHWFSVDAYEAGFSLPQGSNNVSSSINTSSNSTPHIMADPTSLKIAANNETRFSPHISNEHLIRNLGTRGYHQPLGRFDGGQWAGTGDLMIGRMDSPSSVAWGVSYARNGSFTAASAYASDAGDPTDVFLSGDVDGDGDSDLVYGRASSATQVRWFVRKAGRGRFGSYETWVTDAGDVGDVFRMGDVNGDGRDDLIYGRPATGSHNANAIPLTWYVRLSTGSAFGGYKQWLASGGHQGHPVYVRDFDGDGRADLVTARVPTGQRGIWHLYRSTGGGFAAGTRIFAGTGVETDRFFLDDVTGDGRPDLIIGRRGSRTQITWYVRPNMAGRAFGNVTTWTNDVGNSGDLIRVGDATGDGRADLVVIRRDSFTGALLWVSASTGSGFARPQRWGRDISSDGYLVF